MTTIATDGKTMAGDSLTTAKGTILSTQTTKVVRHTDGRIAGCCGLCTSTKAFRRWATEGGDYPTLDDEFSVLYLNTDGTVDWSDKTGELVRYDTPCAIGSGCEYAEGAMLSGKSPAEAVGIAAQRDTHTGGTITELKLN